MSTVAFGLTPFPLLNPLTRPLCSSYIQTQPQCPSKPSMTLDVENLVIIGSGPAGYTAALYSARANLKPIVLEGLSSGPAGGQLMTTSEVENFPGFPEGITGPALMSRMREQASRWGAELIADDCTSVDLDTQPFIIRTSTYEFRTNAVIVATGASAKKLGVQGEDIFWSRGISACAVCDGAAPIFSGRDVAVVGGGDSACEEAVYLCKYAKHVHLLVRGETLRASRTLVDRVMQHPSVSVHFGTVVKEAVGEVDGVLQGLKIRRDGVEEFMNVSGLFYAIGHKPNTGFLRGSSRLRFDERGYLKTEEGGPRTGLGGVFAAGDVADKEWRQAVTAAGSGCMAAIAAERYLSEHGLVREYHKSMNNVEARAAVEERESEAETRAVERGEDDVNSYDIGETWHRGEFALRKLYHESERPLIVKYISPGCGPCAVLGRMLNKVVRGLEGRVHFVEIDITRDLDIAEAAGVTGSPTVQVFFKKGLVKEFRGVKMKSEYQKVVEEVLEGMAVR